MNIAIIGAGNIGTGLARVLGRTRHGVAIADRDPATARTVADTLEPAGIVVQAGTVPDVVRQADVVILAIPFTGVDDVAAAADFAGKVVVDVTNPLTEDFSGLRIGHLTSAAEEIAKALPDATVVKAFNTVFAQVYERGLDFGNRAVPTYVAADDEAARKTVMEIAADAGFDPIDAGALINARYIEPLAYLNIHFGYMLGRGTQIAPAWLSR